jgi:hypothetical protein
VPRKGKSDEEWKLTCIHIHEQVGNVLLAWIQDHWADFSKPLVGSLKSFIDNDLRLDGNLPLVKTLSATINSKVLLTFLSCFLDIISWIVSRLYRSFQRNS